MRLPILLHTALQPEAKPLIAKLSLKKQMVSGSFELFTNDNCALLVSGMGKVRAAAATAAACTRLFPDRRDFFILNIGIAGSATTPIGTLCSVVKCIDRSSAREYYPDMIVQQPGQEVVLETHETPVTDEDLVLDNSHLVDLEGSALFEAARMFSNASRIQSFKVVSDKLKCSIPSRSFISDLIEGILDSVCEFIDEIQSASFLQSDVLSGADKEKLNALTSSLGLTFSQKVMLEDAARFCKSRHNTLPESLPVPAPETITSKEARAKAFLTVRSILEA